MQAQTPLILIALGLVLSVAIGMGSIAPGAAKSNIKASQILSGIMAAGLVVAGLATLVWRRYGATDTSTQDEGVTEDSESNSWKQVLTDALGSWSKQLFGSDFLSNVAKYGLWTTLVIFAIFAMVFIVSIANPSHPLSWLGYAGIAAIFVVLFLTAPVTQNFGKDAGKRMDEINKQIDDTENTLTVELTRDPVDTDKVKQLKSEISGLKNERLGVQAKQTVKSKIEQLASLITTKRNIGIMVVVLVLALLIALGRIYPLVEYSVYGLIIFGILYFARSWWMERGQRVGTGQQQRSAERPWSSTLIRLLRGFFADTLGWLTMSKEEWAEYKNNISVNDFLKDRERTKLLQQYGLIAATLVTSGSIVALAVALPFIWDHLPSLKLQSTFGKRLMSDTLPLSSTNSYTVPISGMSRDGTSQYTVSWWQFINSRQDGVAVPMLELGPIGQVLAGPSIGEQTIALASPINDGGANNVVIPITLQKWQNITIRANGIRADVFVDGKLVGSSLLAPESVRAGDVFTLPGTPPRKTMGGIANLSFSPKAEPYTSILWNSLTSSPKKDAN